MADSIRAAKQSQFLDVVDRDEAERRLHAAINLQPVDTSSIALGDALGRILAADIVSDVDVPSFDRSNLDGFAVRAGDTYGAQEETPKRLALSHEVIATALVPRAPVAADDAMTIATGGMLPRGADAIVMLEHTEVDGESVIIRKPVTPGFGVTFAGTDIARGETVLRRGQVLTSRETGVLAAIGVAEVVVWRRPLVAVISTGDEIVEPGQPMRPGLVYDSNARIVSDAVREAGGEPLFMGIVHDDVDQLRKVVRKAIDTADVVLLSGGTSKGAGDISYYVVRELRDPGIVAHGVALKPGKPICMAATDRKPVVILPGFPTSAIFTFHEFVAPIIRQLGGIAISREKAFRAQTQSARLAVKVNSTIGRTEFLLVSLVHSPGGEDEMAAYPMGKGSGSVTTFSQADGFVRIGQHEEIVEANQSVEVTLLSGDLRPADLVVIGSHCIGLDYLLGKIHELGFVTKFIAVGSTGGLQAAERGECDLAGIHLLDLQSNTYNVPFLSSDIDLLTGYGRLQGLVYRRGDMRFEGKSAREAIGNVANDATCVMVNRNHGSGTRILIDQLLNGIEPSGYAIQARSHNSVVASVAQQRADWGVAIRPAATQSNLGFLPISHERFDFAVPVARKNRPAVCAMSKLLRDSAVRRELEKLGLDCGESI